MQRVLPAAAFPAAACLAALSAGNARKPDHTDQTEAYKRIFRRLDANSDGAVTVPEFLRTRWE